QPCAALLATVARAMHAAHERRIIHRDLKPSNILLQMPKSGLQAAADKPAVGALQSAIPKITDFGLAKRLDRSERLTRSGFVAGTPSYMAPEQFQDRVRDIGPATDVYALGSILYELLTARPPFLGATTVETATQVLAAEPVPPRRLQPGVPRDLETICLKCLEKEPRRRYATAGALADDLQRYLVGESIRARPLSTALRIGKWARRQPAVAALSVVLVLSLVLGFVLVLSQMLRANREWERAETKSRLEAVARQEALDALALARNNEQAEVKARRAAERLSAGAVHDVGVSLCESGDIVRGLFWLTRGLRLAEESGDARPPRVGRAGGRQLVPRPRGQLQQRKWVWAVAISPDGQTVATGGNDQDACLWDAATGQRRGKPLAHPDPVWSVAFSPDGQTLLTGCGS